MNENPDSLVLEHYRKQATKHGDSPQSTMEDVVIRDKELAAIHRFVSHLTAQDRSLDRLLDLGCGNGHTLETIRPLTPGTELFGVDASPDMLEIARTRELPRTDFQEGDARSLAFEDGFFDALYTERCLINLLSAEGQRRALLEIARVVRPGGLVLLIECFTDGMDNNNLARTQVGLEALEPAYHNRYFDKEEFFAIVEPHFRRVPPSELDPEDDGTLAHNFLSSHYFIARVLHPLVTKGEWVRNTEFVKFFSFLPPRGEYSPIQAFLLERREASSETP